MTRRTLGPDLKRRFRHWPKWPVKRSAPDDAAAFGFRVGRHPVLVAGLSSPWSPWSAGPGGYPGRAGGLWLWSTLVLPGFHAVVVPSGFRTSVPPHPVDDNLVVEQNRTHSRVLVLPPFFLCLTWCTSHAEAGWLQPPAHRQCLSRRVTALRIPAGMVSA